MELRELGIDTPVRKENNLETFCVFSQQFANVEV